MEIKPIDLLDDVFLEIKLYVEKRGGYTRSLRIYHRHHAELMIRSANSGDYFRQIYTNEVISKEQANILFQRIEKSRKILSQKTAQQAYEYLTLLVTNVFADQKETDKKRMLEAVKENGLALRCASDELQADKEVVLAAVKQCGYALRYASKELQADKAVVLAAVKSFGSSLEFASEELRNDKAVVLAAIRKFGSSLRYASDDLKDDKELVLEAVKANDLALRYASERLRKELSI